LGYLKLPSSCVGRYELPSTYLNSSRPHDEMDPLLQVLKLSARIKNIYCSFINAYSSLIINILKNAIGEENYYHTPHFLHLL
jgi:hypothetical protein